MKSRNELKREVEFVDVVNLFCDLTLRIDLDVKKRKMEFVMSLEEKMQGC